MAGAAHSLQNCCGFERVLMGSTPIHLRHPMQAWGSNILRCAWIAKMQFRARENYNGHHQQVAPAIAMKTDGCGLTEPDRS